ncbi:MAG: MBL fold metallo-hydrolase [Thermodesulfobacteriota bacterium]
MSPNPDQIEIILFGPGYGECVVVHLGNNHWIIIDSCIDSETQQPAALSYFKQIGIRPEEAVRLIIATHWHDDHIRGLSRVLTKCKKARFCCSAALTQEEFLATVLDYESRPTMVLTSGLNEIFEVYNELKTRSKPECTPIYASSNKSVYFVRPEISGHGSECRVWTLSPSDRQFQKFFDELTRLMPRVKETKKRATLQGPNNVSVVTWISIGDIALLLGADLEEIDDEGLGWSVIVTSPDRPIGKASIFKIPHHGSISSHNEMVWQQMVTTPTYAILSPFCHGPKSLPSPEDVVRITSHTENAYITAKISLPTSKKERAKMVLRTIRETVGKIRMVQQTTGWIRLRNGGNQNPNIWSVELSKTACHLSQVHGRP